ncbi:MULTISPECIES: hypothetical protein [Prochlorococcus]|uniref:Uncharacterized protein n=1 Tax=Prochlorococcus marinus (strain SARG / CCMP1375 / SS120) TaxID=167539 RepID=Q7VDB8_PROMA|nr:MULTISPECIES: hypothetical protein [Prochlorococcus]AAP99508.1 Predicted protein [Prochlorococcus marinus subsp. marinus str. CCMP1375]
MFEFIVGSHEFLGNHTFAEFLVGYIFGAALIIGAPTVFLLLAFISALMKTNGKMGGYKEYETYGASTLNECPPFILPDPTNPKSKSSNNRQNTSKRGRFA